MNNNQHYNSYNNIIYNNSQNITEYELYKQYRKNSKGTQRINNKQNYTLQQEQEQEQQQQLKYERIEQENKALKHALKEAEKGWQEAILFAREMQEHLKVKENRLNEAIFQIDVLKEQLTQNSKLKSFSSGSSSEISLSSNRSHNQQQQQQQQNRDEAQYYLLESELQMYKRQMSKQQNEKTEYLKNIHSLILDLSISFSTLLSSMRSILSIPPFTFNQQLQQSFQEFILQKTSKNLLSSSSPPTSSPTSLSSVIENNSLENLIQQILFNNINDIKQLSGLCNQFKQDFSVTKPFLDNQPQNHEIKHSSNFFQPNQSVQSSFTQPTEHSNIFSTHITPSISSSSSSSSVISSPLVEDNKKLERLQMESYIADKIRNEFQEIIDRIDRGISKNIRTSLPTNSIEQNVSESIIYENDSLNVTNSPLREKSKSPSPDKLKQSKQIKFDEEVENYQNDIEKDILTTPKNRKRSSSESPKRNLSISSPVKSPSKSISPKTRARSPLKTSLSDSNIYVKSRENSPSRKNSPLRNSSPSRIESRKQRVSSPNRLGKFEKQEEKQYPHSNNQNTPTNSSSINYHSQRTTPSCSRLFSQGIHGYSNRVRAIGSIKEHGKTGVPHTLLILSE